MSDKQPSSFDVPHQADSDPHRPPVVGAPTELASQEEVPDWFASLVAYVAALPLLVSVAIGLIGFSTFACCLLVVFLSVLGN
jgi:hypothetical protein